MTEVRVVERHYDNTRDDEGMLYYAFNVDTGSDEFRRFMEEFHVWDKYQRGQVSEARSYVIKGELQYLTADAYFNGWITDYGRENPGKEMCYITVEQIHSTRDN